MPSLAYPNGYVISLEGGSIPVPDLRFKIQKEFPYSLFVFLALFLFTREKNSG